MAVRTPDEHPHGDDTALLIAALDHLWAVYDATINRMYQIVNYFLVASAILVTGYAAAINGKHYGIAVVLSIAGIGLAVSVAMFVRRELSFAILVVPALTAVREKIAVRLETDSISRVPPPGRQPWLSVRITASIPLLVLALIGIGSLLYALIR